MRSSVRTGQALVAIGLLSMLSVQAKALSLSDIAGDYESVSTMCTSNIEGTTSPNKRILSGSISLSQPNNGQDYLSVTVDVVGPRSFDSTHAIGSLFTMGSIGENAANAMFLQVGSNEKPTQSFMRLVRSGDQLIVSELVKISDGACAKGSTSTTIYKRK